MWRFSSECKSKVRLDGKTVIITGANIGIGKETARDLYRRGARVILACRDIEKANIAIEDLKAKVPSRSNRDQFNGQCGELVIYKLNLCSFSSVRQCAKLLIENEIKINILINNAGIMACPFALTEDGYETQFQTNHLGHFLLTLLLLPKMMKSTPCRIINVSSVAHRISSANIYLDDINLSKSYTPVKAYGQSKLANILFTKELARRLEKAKIEDINVYSLHPGVIATELARHLDSAFFPGARAFWNLIAPIFMKQPESGIQTTLHCAVSEEADKETGLYYCECKVTLPSTKARNAELACKLWDKSVTMVGLKPTGNFEELLNAAHELITTDH